MKRWQLVQELFEETTALDAGQRARVLRERAPDDAKLAREVEALVAADAHPRAEFERTATDLLLELRDDEPPAEELCGAVFGAYRIEAHLSSGGMAHVYRATRASAGTERRVALKVLRPGLDTEAFLARFRRERETLAALEHEHVVAFLDAGTLPDGRPFLVMEYVEGVPLTRWGRGVPLRARLELFLQVLAAVQYAHHKLIVHRDLKPSNVMVTGAGVPKLLDFGVASVLDPVAEPVREAVSRAPLTPGYASPEQLRGEAVTTASDVYSLGALLHELATGELPAENAAREARSSDSAPRLDGDLGAIARKALAVDAAERYRSADHLASDLRRFLAHEPVSARAGTWTYRARLFARRHRGPLALAAALVAATVAGWIGSDLDRRSAEREAGLGWGAHAQARFFAGALEDWIVSAAAADGALGAEAAADLEAVLREDFSRFPEAETLMHMTLAELYLERGEPERAREHAERAWQLAQDTRGIGTGDRARAASLLERTTPTR